MDSSSFTVFFDDPFWVGVYERREGARLEACRVVFGPEPKDYDVYAFLLDRWHTLRFSPAVAAEKSAAPQRSPKRRQREAARALQGAGVGTKAQQALALQREALKTDRLEAQRRRAEEEKQRRFALRQSKKKEKHKGH